LDIVRLFKSLGDETRLRLLHLLLHHELNVNELVRIMDMGQSRISRHLKILADSGLLQSRRDGSYIYYTRAGGADLAHLTDFIIQAGGSRQDFAADLEKTQELLDERKHRVKTFFNSLVDDWDLLKQEVLGDFSLKRIVAREAQGANTAADLGCGTGEMLLELGRHAQRVIGVDSSAGMLEKSRQRLSGSGVNADLRLGELEHLPIRNGETDLVVMEMVLRHVAVPLEGIKEVSRVLEPGGRFIMADFDRHDQEEIRYRYGGVWAGFDREQLRQWLQQAGLDLLQLEQHWVQQGLGVNVCLAVKPQGPSGKEVFTG